MFPFLAMIPLRLTVVSLLAMRCCVCVCVFVFCSLEWSHDVAIFRVDDVEHFRADLNRNWYSGVGPNPYTANYQPWDQRFHLVLNVAVGGGFFGGAYIPGFLSVCCGSFSHSSFSFLS